MQPLASAIIEFAAMSGRTDPQAEDDGYSKKLADRLQDSSLKHPKDDKSMQACPLPLKADSQSDSSK